MSELLMVPLGGMGRVTQNMFLYEYENDILIVDSGIGFPDVYMPGVDAIIPDISYLLQQLEHGKRIVGLVLSHGHEDHIGALSYILPDLPDFPIYGSALTIGFARERLLDKGIERNLHVIQDGEAVNFGENFSVKSHAMTHSVPDTKHLVITTPEGVIYHGSDFKLDPNPVDGILPDFKTITEVGQKGVLLALLDCLRVERPEPVRSESTVGPELAGLMMTTKGKFIVTLMSSHIHRIQQIVDAAAEQGRKVAFVGRSVEQNVKISLELGKLAIPEGVKISKREINDYPENKVCVVIAGSQGQEGSSLVRAVYGEHRSIIISPQDKVVFSADAIPGNEIPYYRAVDELSRNEVEVIYPDVNANIHQSGHASAAEQQELLSLIKSRFVMPIGGADRHRTLFKHAVAMELGYQNEQVLLPKDGEILGFSQGRVRVVQKISLNPRIVDGLGVGDVGPVVLSDRLSLSQAGIIVLVLPRFKGEFDLSAIMVVSRGFVFMKEADEVIAFIKEKTAEIIDSAGQMKDDELRRHIEKKLAKQLYSVIKREPMIVPVIMEG